MKKTVFLFTLLFCLLLSCCGCGARGGKSGRAETPSGQLQIQDYYDEFDRRIPTLECAIPDARRTETDGEDENGSYHGYEYTWNDPDVYALGERFSAWLEALNGLEGIGAEPHLNGTYYILVDGVRVGLADSSRTDEEVRVRIRFYTENAS